LEAKLKLYVSTISHVENMQLSSENLNFLRKPLHQVFWPTMQAAASISPTAVPDSDW